MNRTLKKLKERLKLEVLCYHCSQESMDYVLQESKWLYKQPKKNKKRQGVDYGS